jgi:hypothetical protein
MASDKATEKLLEEILGVPAPRKSIRAELREKIKQTKVGVGEIDISKPAELIVLGVKKREAARCRLLGQDKELTLRTSGLWNVAPGEIVTVMPKKHWSYAGHPYLSADITGTRFDLAALNLTPLKLTDEGMWDPKMPMPTWATSNSIAGRKWPSATTTSAAGSASCPSARTFPASCGGP